MSALKRKSRVFGAIFAVGWHARVPRMHKRCYPMDG